MRVSNVYLRNIKRDAIVHLNQISQAAEYETLSSYLFASTGANQFIAQSSLNAQASLDFGISPFC